MLPFPSKPVEAVYRPCGNRHILFHGTPTIVSTESDSKPTARMCIPRRFRDVAFLHEVDRINRERSQTQLNHTVENTNENRSLLSLNELS